MPAIQRQLLISVTAGIITLTVWNFLIKPLIGGDKTESF